MVTCVIPTFRKLSSEMNGAAQHSAIAIANGAKYHISVCTGCVNIECAVDFYFFSVVVVVKSGETGK